MRLAPRFAFAFAVAAAATGCLADADGDGDDDPADESFITDGKGDGAIAEGSPDAHGILQLVNNGSYAQLKSTGITGTALKNIESYRLGPDKLPYSSDDKGFASLAELDAVKYVGTTTFNRLLAYARSNGYVSALPFAPTTCADRFTSTARMAEISNNFQEEVFGGAVWARTRECRGTVDAVCTEWSDVVKLGQPDDTWIEFSKDGDKVLWRMNYHRLDKAFVDANTPVESVTSFEWPVEFAPGVITFNPGSATSRVGQNSQTQAFTWSSGTITDTCLRTSGTLQFEVGDVRYQDEYTFVTEL